MPNSSYGTARKLGAAKAREFSLVSQYKLGYRNREDITNLPPGVLIVGSQNVLTNVSERIQVRPGYALDGQVSSIAAPILGSFDWPAKGGDAHIRAGFNTDGTNGKLQYRHEASDGTVTWNDLTTNLTSTNFNFVSFWDSTELLNVSLGVNGTSNIYEWNGAVTTVVSTSNGSGIIAGLAAVPTNGGTGYALNDVLTITTGGTGGTAKVLQTSNQGVSVASVNSGGSGYAAGDVLVITGASPSLINGGNGAQILQNATLRVDSVSSGAITGATILTAGTGYTSTTGATTYQIQSATGNILNGSGATFDTTVANGVIQTVSLLTGGINYSGGSGKSTTVVPAGGSGATLNITDTEHNSITVSDNPGEAGFYSSRNKGFIIRGVSYTYVAVFGSTFVGVSPDPTAQGSNNPVAGDLLAQTPVVTNLATLSGIPSTFTEIDLIGNLNNQVFLGSLINSTFYVSKFGNYTDYRFSSPRLPAEGATATLDANLVAFKVQENVMYISAGKDFWYNTQFTLSADTTKESFTIVPLKTGTSQGAKSQAFVSHMKNNVIMITQEPTMDMFGRLENFFGTPQTKNISDPIKLDFDQYDFTDGSIFYWRYFILVAIPKEGIVRIFNLNTNNWEAPQNLPISRFYLVNGELYGHSYSSSESYQLFTGFADRVYPGFLGSPIDAKAVFSYQNYGSRHALKKANSFYIEGYISANTKLTCTLTYELDGCATTRTFMVDGSDTQIVCIRPTEGALGKFSLGKIKLGGDVSSNLTGLPPKFRVEKTYSNHNFFECNFTFEILGTNQRFELLAFGLNEGIASEESTYIRQ